MGEIIDRQYFLIKMPIKIDSQKGNSLFSKAINAIRFSNARQMKFIK